MRMIKLFEQNGRIFVWEAEAVHELRTKHRIIGSLIGCFPRQTFQNSHRWLPLLLLPEEAALLREKGAAELLTNLSVEKVPDPEVVKEYWENRESLCEEQIKKMKEVRMKTVLEKADVIYEGKKRRIEKEEEKTGTTKKLKPGDIEAPQEESGKCISGGDTHVQKKGGNTGNSTDPSTVAKGNSTDENSANGKEQLVAQMGNVSVVSSSCDEANKGLPHEGQKPEETEMAEKISSNAEACSKDTKEEEEQRKKAIIEKEMAKMPNLNKENCSVQLFTECPWKRDADMTSSNWLYPRSECEKVRYAVFRDLWERGYYMTSGTKFGGDFLVYAGDPIKYHALFIIFCIQRNQSFQAHDLVVYGRLGNQVKKSAVLASVLSDGRVKYVSLKWASDMG